MTNESVPIIHVLTVFDAFTEEMVDVLRFRRFDLKAFLLQFAVDTTSDPHMTDRYAIGPDDTPLVNEALGYEHFFNFKEFAYFIEAALDQ